MQWCPYCEKITAHSSDDCPAPKVRCSRCGRIHDPVINIGKKTDVRARQYKDD